MQASLILRNIGSKHFDRIYRKRNDTPDFMMLLNGDKNEGNKSIHQKQYIPKIRSIKNKPKQTLQIP